MTAAPPPAPGPYSEAPQLLLFRRRLRAAMKAAGYPSALSLARIIGMSRTGLSRYLDGTRLPSALALVQLERALGVSADWLLGFDVSPLPNARNADAASTSGAEPTTCGRSNSM